MQNFPGCHKGQGATEYLVLLAVVLIVAIVSVALLGFFPGMASDAQMTQSQTYWSGTARPFQVTEASSSVETMCGIASSSGYTMVLQNSEADTLTITGLVVDNSSGFCVSGGTANAPVSIGPGERRTFSVITASFDSPCIEKQIVQLGLNITYRTALISGKVQSGTKKLMLRCSTSNSVGGNITEAGGYRIHTFTGAGTFIANKAMTVEVLVVGGGGGGGKGSPNSGGGGGGAGGLVYSASKILTPQSYNVIIGNGGSDSNGGNSIFGDITAIGGGKGGNYGVAGSSGGSGGGSGRDMLIGNGGAGTGGQGYAGGSSLYTFYGSAGGGGGSGGTGYNGDSDNVPRTGTLSQGGVGLNYSISGSNVYYAGGGGGSWESGGSGGPGGLGGGGSGGRFGAGVAGTSNTGGGGGGSYGGTSVAGGSGIVIVRYR